MRMLRRRSAWAAATASAALVVVPALLSLAPQFRQNVRDSSLAVPHTSQRWRPAGHWIAGFAGGAGGGGPMAGGGPVCPGGGTTGCGANGPVGGGGTAPPAPAAPAMPPAAPAAPAPAWVASSGVPVQARNWPHEPQNSSPAAFWKPQLPQIMPGPCLCAASAAPAGRIDQRPTTRPTGRNPLRAVPAPGVCPPAHARG